MAKESTSFLGELYETRMRVFGFFFSANSSI